MTNQRKNENKCLNCNSVESVSVDRRPCVVFIAPLFPPFSISTKNTIWWRKVNTDQLDLISSGRVQNAEDDNFDQVSDKHPRTTETF